MKNLSWKQTYVLSLIQDKVNTLWDIRAVLAGIDRRRAGATINSLIRLRFVTSQHHSSEGDYRVTRLGWDMLNYLDAKIAA